MTVITIALPTDKAAADLAGLLYDRGATNWPLPLDLIEQALVEWSIAEIANLLANVPGLVDRAGPTSHRLREALFHATIIDSRRPRLVDLRDRRKAAKTLSMRFGHNIEAWQLLELWQEQIGCNVCQFIGPRADCWGRPTCHGFENGCGCIDCLTRRRIETINGVEENRVESL